MSRVHTTEKVQVYAGGTDEGNPDQIVDANFLETAEPPPEGVTILLLAEKLQFNEYVSITFCNDIQFFCLSGASPEF